MVQLGGPAAINGFLYQILSHLGWLAEIRIKGRISGTDVPGDMCLVLEPKDGGDARCEAPGVYLVEQYKVRPDSTWSAQTIIDDVLPDLRYAVPEPPVSNAKYRFVTDGRAGRLDNFRAFLKAVNGISDPSILDDTESYKFGLNLPNTFRSLFDYILTKTNRSSERSRADATATVLHLLKNFEMDFEVGADRHSDLIEKMLRPLCANLGDESGKRQQLVGILMERLSKGEDRLDVAAIDELLRSAALDPDRLRKLARLNEMLAYLVDDSLERIGYQASIDVRQPPEWPEGKSILLIAGKSGEGKTWQLANLSRAEADACQRIVWIYAGQDTESTLKRAMRVVWQEGLGCTDEKTPMALTAHYQEMVHDAAMPWLTIAIDDVQSPELARDLVRQPWGRWGMRLALSVPERVASAVQHAASDVHVHRITRFSVNQISDLLDRKGRNWGELPSDLQQLLRTPILAGLYLDLPYDTISTAPNCEYEIFEAFWNRMQEMTAAGDDGILMSIAARVLGGRSYPVARTCWDEVNLDVGAIERLQATGWINCLSGGIVDFAHDRLLNWAVAELLLQQLLIGDLSAVQLVEKLLQCADSPSGQLSKNLGYVPMDVLWLLAADQKNTHEITNIIKCLIESQHYGSYGEVLYLQLLPTLGTRIVCVLQNLLKGIPERDFRFKMIAQCFSALAVQDEVNLSGLTGSLLCSASIDKQSVGIAIATTKPSPQFLDRLWELHQERCAVLDYSHEELQRSPWDIQDYEASFAALRAGIQTDPTWLRDRIKKADPRQERVNQFAYLLNNLDHPSALDIWSEVKNELIEKVPKDRPRSLLYCIGRFGDFSGIDFVVSCLTREEDFASGAAFANLVKLDPDLAIKKLPEIYRFELAASRGWWLPQLLRVRPDATRRKLLEMAHNRDHGSKLLDNLFTGRANQLDAAMLRFRLRELESALEVHSLSACQGHPWITFPLRLLNEVTRPDLLEVLRQEVGSPLEHMVTEVACKRVPGRSDFSDHVLEECRLFLININGNGITNLVNYELNSCGYWERYGGLGWAYCRPNTDTISILKDICRRPVIDKVMGERSDGWSERYRATIALAAIGSDDGVIESIWAEGPEAVAGDLNKFRGMLEPIDKGCTSRASEKLAQQISTEEEILKSLTIAWLSKDVDFIPSVQHVLSSSDLDSQVARMACIALIELRDTSIEFYRLALAMLRTKTNSRHAINALLAIGKDVASELVNYLNDIPLAGWDDTKIQLAERLFHFTEAREDVIQWAVQLCKEWSLPMAMPPLEIAAEADDAEVRELIICKSFSENDVVVDEKVRAIQALAKFDYERAVMAVKRQLRITNKEMRQLARLLVHLSPVGSVAFLVDIAQIRENNVAAVGHALRRLDHEEVDSELARYMTDPQRTIRAVGVELAGWLPPGRLVAEIEAMLEVETEDKPRQAALKAVERKEEQAITADLLDAFEKSSGENRWPLLLALLKVGDPYLLSDRDDSLWIGKALNQAPYIFKRHAKEMLKNRKHKIK